jgi:hypothetical protein
LPMVASLAHPFKPVDRQTMPRPHLSRDADAPPTSR